MPIIDIARSQAERQDLALIIDDQVQLEAIEPADRGLATSSTAVKDAMGVDASVVTDGKGGGVDKADAATLTQLGMQIGHQWNQHGGHQLDKARVAHQDRKLTAQMTVDIFGIVGFEGAVVRLVEQDENGHDFDWDACRSNACAGAVPMSADRGASLGQTAARNRLRNKRVRVYS